MEKNDFVEIDIREIIFVILKKWYLIAICFIIAVGSSFAITQYYIKPVYKAQTTLFLGKESGKLASLSFADIQVNNQLVTDYRELLKSDLVAESIKQKLGVNANKFKGSVNVETVKDSRIFSISYEDTDPELAANVVNELALVIKQMASDIIEVKNVKVIDTAKIPESPVSPSKKKNVGLAGVLGIALGAALIYILEMMDYTFKKPEEVEKQLGLNLIGVVPKFEGGKRGKQKKKDQKQLEQDYLKNLVTKNDPKAPASEAFREIRTNLHYISVDKELKTIVVTSPSLGDGKTVTAVNMAVALAKSGKKVLVIDTDLRKPKVHLYFGIKNNEGITNMLTEDKESKKVKPATVDGIPNLNIISSGPIPPNPAEILSSNRMNQLLEQLKSEYDLIIIDTPPVGQVTDAAILAGIADGTVLVCASSQTRIDMAKRAKKALDSVNSNIVGAVLTKIDTGRASYYNYEYK
ncbi:polysaccharide biosynthesis tyrosine autokinase [Acetivibrio cellulolyticus]|uniref:polysaccharide biosynthesis tyrosine autokinase n=1 Tax=Acetivibrio cellulolyticus TaxID=35830 RepID=UPI0001E2CBEB|nr:polysaccharide biosynthesis tyrosine autokinase [Acetivibrio cellulolyticus]